MESSRIASETRRETPQTPIRKTAVKMAKVACDPAGRIRLSALLEISEDAIRRVIGKDAIPVEFNTTHFHPTTADTVQLKCREITATQETALWQSSVTTQGGTLIALLSLRFELASHAQGAVGTPSALEPNEAALHLLKSDEESDLRQRKIEKLMSAATDVIAEKGFASATMREIASAAGVHVPTLYQYVSSKEALLEQVYRRELSTASQMLRQEVTADTDPETRLRQLIARHVTISDTRRKQIGILNREFKHLSPDARREMVLKYRDMLKPFQDVLEDGITQGVFRQMDTFLVSNFIDVAGDIWSLRQFFFDTKDLDAFKLDVTEFLMAGVRRSASTSRQ